MHRRSNKNARAWNFPIISESTSTRGSQERKDLLMKRLACLFAVLGLAGCDLDLTDLAGCDYSRDLTEQIDASGLTELIADTQAGDLRIEGVPGSNSVRVRAYACASSSSTLHDIDFDLARHYDRAELTTYVPSYDGARLDLVIEVPQDFDADIYDTSGDIDIRRINTAWIDDGSGDIDARDLWGDLIVRHDRSGHVYFSNIRGHVQLP